MYAIIFLLLFAGILALYGFVLYRTGDATMLPYRARHSVRGKGDVKRVGLIVLRIGLLFAAVLCVTLLACHIFAS